MSPRLSPDRSFDSELRSVLATLQCLSEYAFERGDKQAAAILHNAAAILELSVAFPSTQEKPLPPHSYEQPDVAFA
ncbi:hypothetical protein [Roseomonas sp. KE2513]|uniref:hypothetical protein n=1 Tax=Roseomonas sp. KE2513 TaxID=2479202 RepID=UPI0018DF1916|nr:hypothetical protein [Roseomonas sp. KE2513]